MSIEFFDVKNIKVANIKNSSDIAFFGIVCLSGSNYETEDVSGISHYIEHLNFKGSKKRTWKQINQEFAMLGANNNAYTGNTEVVYHSTAPKENIQGIIEVMLDMFFNSTFPEDEIEKERQVIIEEKKMYDDDPKSAFNSAIGNNFFEWSLGHDTIGTYETIKSINREKMIQYLNQTLSPENIVFVCCGDIDSNDLRKYIEDNMPNEHPYLTHRSMNVVNCGLWSDIIDKPDKIKMIIKRKNIQQSNVSMLTQGLSISHPYYHDLVVAYKCLGGGMYSKLHTRIREELGLCYSVGMVNFAIDYPSKTITELYGYTSQNNVDKFIEESEKILENTLKNGLDKEIFLCAKTDHLSQILKHTETSAGKAMFLANRILVDKNVNYEDVIQKARNVTLEKSNELICAMLKCQYNWAVMVPE